jgi:ABC-2 type transport system permease protein
MRPELIVAEKEFRDHVTSKRFIVIFGILLLLAIYAINLGMDSYNQKLNAYNNPQDDPNNRAKQDLIKAYQNMIADAQATGQSPEKIQGMQNELNRVLNPPMPSILEVFQYMIGPFTFVGMILGAAMGFDQISRERDEGSLKFLVSSPVYRDAIINGKTIGAIAALAAAMAAVFAITIAIVMVRSVIPDPSDLARIILFFVAAMLYCTVFFALAMMLSTIAKNTALAAVSTVGVVFLLALFSLVAIGLSGLIAGWMIGPAPAGYDPHISVAYDNGITEYNGNVSSPQALINNEYHAYRTKISSTTSQVADVLTTISPISDFSGIFGTSNNAIGTALLAREKDIFYMMGSPQSLVDRDRSLSDSLASIWIKVLTIVAEIVALFGVAYITFMKADIR